MTVCYQIIDWDTHFENFKSRTHDRCSFVCMPNKQHGLGFKRIWSEPDGAAIFGVWCALLQKASQQRRPRLGWLTENGHDPADASDPGIPFTVEVLAVLFGTDKTVVQRALDVVCSPNIGWVRKIDAKDTAVSSEGYRKDTAVSSEGYRKDTAVSSEGYRSIQKEGRKEGTESILEGIPAGAEPRTPFKAPAWEDTPEYKQCQANRRRVAELIAKQSDKAQA